MSLFIHIGLERCEEVQSKWQIVQFVEKAIITELKYAIHIEDQIEFGNQTSNVLAAKLTEHLENYMYVLPV